VQSENARSTSSRLAACPFGELELVADKREYHANRDEVVLCEATAR